MKLDRNKNYNLYHRYAGEHDWQLGGVSGVCDSFDNDKGIDLSKTLYQTSTYQDTEVFTSDSFEDETDFIDRLNVKEELAECENLNDMSEIIDTYFDLWREIKSLTPDEVLLRYDDGDGYTTEKLERYTGWFSYDNVEIGLFDEEGNSCE